MSFNQAVLEWLIEKEPKLKVKEVANVEAYGSDWEGGTEEGFYTETSLRILYLNEEDEQRTYYVPGELFEELWLYLMGKWPKEK